MKKNNKIEVKGVEITFSGTKNEDFICITDIAKYKNPDAPRDVIKNWMRTKNTIELLGLWEKLNNPNFKQVEFDLFRNEVGFNYPVLNQIAISQMKILLDDNYAVKKLGE